MGALTGYNTQQSKLVRLGSSCFRADRHVRSRLFRHLSGFAGPILHLETRRTDTRFKIRSDSSSADISRFSDPTCFLPPPIISTRTARQLRHHTNQTCRQPRPQSAAVAVAEEELQEVRSSNRHSREPIGSGRLPGRF